MNIDFSPVDESFIESQVNSGHYTNKAEFVRDAVRRVREANEAKRERLLRALELGEADIAAGRTEPYTPELRAQILAEARRHAAEGRKPNPDVIP